MKQSRRFFFALLLCTLAASPLNAAENREARRIHQGKITKNEAQHLALKKFPGATVKKCELTSGRDHSVWVMDVVKAGSKTVTKIEVDGLSGKVTP